MVRVSGLDLIRQLRAKGFTGEILVLTAYAGTLDENKYKQLAVDRAMRKPFDIADLLEWMQLGTHDDFCCFRALASIAACTAVCGEQTGGISKSVTVIICPSCM